jgi:ABC-2 type transport system ATP-binding protein
MTEVRAKEKTTVFLTTHYLDEAEDVDRVCIINKGKIVSLGTPDEIKQSLVQHYLLVDSEERLKLRVELEQHGLRFDDSEYPMKVFLQGNNAQEVIKMIDTPLSVLEIHQPSLEDAYLSIVGEK